MVLGSKNSKDREILLNKISGAITRVFVEALKILETNIKDEELYRQLRYRILQTGNEQINYVYRLLNRYEVVYKPVRREVFERDDKRS